MFKKILIANRGEIAVRIIRACRELDIKTVAVYSVIDKDSLHVQLADEAVCIGPAPSAQSYLNMQNIISAALISGAEAIHPGYGFLAENSEFAELCAENDLVFIGPDKTAIDKMGDKAYARETMKKAGVPVVPGSEGVLETAEEAVALAAEIGYPVIVKASAGGGGRGMRIAWSEEELVSAFATARTEAASAFGNPEVYLEKFIEQPRHIEIQIIGDKYGNVVYLGERDCSVQRRNQKMIEESPSCAITPELRRQMGEIAVQAAKAANYYSAGTIEFLFDRYNNFYFMEMNTRIQVEHTVTEVVTGLDLLKEQIKVAAGEKLSFNQEDIKVGCWAIECRINAENPEMNFMPCPGTISKFLLPGGPGVRVDTSMYEGAVIPPTYDSMIGKLITWGKDREEAIARMKRALAEFRIEGIKTTIGFHLQVMDNEVFRSGDINTSFIQQQFLNK